MNKCIRCGRYTNNTFCDYCNLEMQSQIKKPTLQQFHNKYDNKKIWKCNCGIYVRSQGERTIADYLFKHKIPFKYEMECRYGEYNTNTHQIKGKFIIPDFYIEGPVYINDAKIENVYLEFWGRKDEIYLKRKEEKMKVYRAHNSTLINIYFSDLYDYKSNLLYKLTNFKNGEINY